MVVSGVSGGDQKMGLFFGSLGLLCRLNLLSGMVSYNGWGMFFCREVLFYLGNVVASTPSEYMKWDINGHSAFITCAVSETSMMNLKGMLTNGIYFLNYICIQHIHIYKYSMYIYIHNIQIHYRYIQSQHRYILESIHLKCDSPFGMIRILTHRRSIYSCRSSRSKIGVMAI